MAFSFKRITQNKLTFAATILATVYILLRAIAAFQYEPMSFEGELFQL